MDAWIGLVGIVIGIILSEGMRWFRDWRAGKEKYRVMTYEKRLEVYQKAFYHVEQLLDEFVPCVSGGGYPNEEALVFIYREAKSFYDSNCLYLDERSRSEMLEGLQETRICLDELDTDLMESTCDQLCKAQEAIEAGIGMKHIEKPKKEQTEGKS